MAEGESEGGWAGGRAGGAAREAPDLDTRRGGVAVEGRAQAWGCFVGFGVEDGDRDGVKDGDGDGDGEGDGDGHGGGFGGTVGFCRDGEILPTWARNVRIEPFRNNPKTINTNPWAGSAPNPRPRPAHPHSRRSRASHCPFLRDRACRTSGR